MRHTTLRVATLFVVALMALSVFAIAPAAADVIDSEDADWAGDDTDVVEGFDADDGNSTVIYETEQVWDADATTADEVTADEFDTLELEVVSDNRTLATYEADDDAIDFDDEATGDTPAEVTFVVEDEDLDTLAGDAGDASTVTAEITEVFEDADHADADDDDLVTVETDFAVDYEFADTYALVYVDEPDESDTIDDPTGVLGSLSMGIFGDADEIPIQSYDETVGIIGDNTTVHVYDATEDGEDAFDHAMDDLDAGDVAFGAAATVDGDVVPVFYEEVDDDLVDETDDTYVVYDSGEFVVNLGADDFDADDEEIDVFVDSQNALNADIDAADVADLYADSLEFGFGDLSSEFGILGTMWDLGVLPIIG